MSKMKKVLLMCTAYVLVAALAIGGTVAYLQSEDSDVNVMTLGNVSIEQVEQERDENGDLVDFTQEKPLYPATGEIAWNDNKININGHDYSMFGEKLKNAQDKIVTVKNTGRSDAYVRTIIALEDPFSTSLVGVNVGGVGYAQDNWITVMVGGVQYSVSCFTYDAALEPNEVSLPSLLQVYLNSVATNEDVALLGETYDILALSQAIQTNGFANADTALDTGFGEFNADNAAKWLKSVITDTWDGTADTAWYYADPTATEFTLTTAEELAGLADLVDDGNTFADKTIKLGKNLDLAGTVFDPIGSYRNNKAFKGTFDGQGYAVSGLNQNTWALDNGYEYGDLGLGLFGKVEDATIKNLTIDGASISGESAICGSVAATAYGDCTFENITVKNSEVNDYQYYAGGVVGWASGDHTYKNITIDETTVIGSQWGDFGNANGGIIGGAGTSGTYHFEDCTVACRIDATNDVVSAYQWYNYRNSGMLIGQVGPETIVNEVTTVQADNVTCKNVTVIYGDWANYTYCEFAGTGYPYVRVQAGVSVDAYSNVRYGHPTDANGNTVVDDNHVHNDGEAHHKLIAFDQLFGGPANHRYCYYGIDAFDGVTVIYNNK